MVFGWVYGFRLGLWFSLGFVVLLWVYGFPLGLCVSFLWVDVILMFFRLWVNRYKPDTRSAG